MNKMVRANASNSTSIIGSPLDLDKFIRGGSESQDRGHSRFFFNDSTGDGPMSDGSFDYTTDGFGSVTTWVYDASARIQPPLVSALGSDGHALDPDDSCGSVKTLWK